MVDRKSKNEVCCSDEEHFLCETTLFVWCVVLNFKLTKYPFLSVRWKLAKCKQLVTGNVFDNYHTLGSEKVACALFIHFQFPSSHAGPRRSLQV